MNHVGGDNLLVSLLLSMFLGVSNHSQLIDRIYTLARMWIRDASVTLDLLVFHEMLVDLPYRAGKIDPSDRLLLTCQEIISHSANVSEVGGTSGIRYPKPSHIYNFLDHSSAHLVFDQIQQK